MARRSFLLELTRMHSRLHRFNFRADLLRTPGQTDGIAAPNSAPAPHDDLASSVFLIFLERIRDPPHAIGDEGAIGTHAQEGKTIRDRSLDILFFRQNQPRYLPRLASCIDDLGISRRTVG